MIQKKKNISFGSLVRLNNYEQNLKKKIESLVSNHDKNISCQISTTLIEWNGNHILVKVDKNSAKDRVLLIEEIEDLIRTGEDIEHELEGSSLIVDIEFKKKETDMSSQNVKNKGNVNDPLADTPDYLPIKGKYDFSQLIIPEELKSEILDALKIIQCKELIYEKWGFNEVDSTPRSVLNFYGPPGTGKTMCAHAIAGYLNKPLLALNYSEIESKYVGDAAKNLQKAFNVAKEKDAILFFDEADSFLGKRIENVSHGSDQALNSLRSQMLILMEDFEGVIIFATNLVSNFDHAFESRILKHLKFDLPNEEARVAIIKKMLPPRLPYTRYPSESEFLEISKEIDGFSGREIKGTILGLLLLKASVENTEDIRFSFEDIKDAFIKKKKSLKDLKAEEERRLKEKIEKKIKEKAEEARALRNQEESPKEDTSSEENKMCEGDVEKE